MAIGMAKQQGSLVIVYNEKNQQIFSKIGILHGYTSSTVTVKSGNLLVTYNEKGNQTGSTFA